MSAELDVLAALTSEIHWLREDIHRLSRCMQAETSIQFLALASLLLSLGGPSGELPPAVVGHLTYMAERARSLADELRSDELLEMVGRFVDENGRLQEDGPAAG